MNEDQPPERAMMIDAYFKSKELLDYWTRRAALAEGAGKALTITPKDRRTLLVLSSMYWCNLDDGSQADLYFTDPEDGAEFFLGVPIHVHMNV